MLEAHGELGESWTVRIAFVNSSSTVPLLCCRRGFEVEGVHEVEGGFTQTQLMQCGPQVDDVALALAVGIEALELAQRQVDAEGSAPAIATMDRAGAASLRTAAFQPRGQAEMIEQARHRQLRLEVGEIDEGVLRIGGSCLPRGAASSVFGKRACDGTSRGDL